MNNTLIALGSNLSDPETQIIHAINQLKRLPNTTFNTHSSFYQTPELNGRNQPNYINAVAWIQTSAPPLELLKQLQSIEIAMGRPKKHQHHAARIIDLDIILYENKTITTRQLIIPHPGLFLRNFVLYPAHEVAPKWRLPNGKTIEEMLQKTPLEPPKCIKVNPKENNK